MNTAKFKEDILAVCEKHNLFISHEGGHGAFLIESGRDISDKFKNILIKWFCDAELVKPD